MASFAKLNSENIVTTVESVVNEVLKDSNGVEQEQLGIDFLKTLYNEPSAIWKQTSYNTHGGTHDNGGIPFRKNHAGIGYIYDEARDAFIQPKLYNSWILNENTCIWEAPIPYPITYTKNLVDGLGNPLSDPYVWNESTLTWDLAKKL
jgi:hypothetical protein